VAATAVAAAAVTLAKLRCVSRGLACPVTILGTAVATGTIDANDAEKEAAGGNGEIAPLAIRTKCCTGGTGDAAPGAVATGCGPVCTVGGSNEIDPGAVATGCIVAPGFCAGGSKDVELEDVGTGCMPACETAPGAVDTGRTADKRPDLVLDDVGTECRTTGGNDDTELVGFVPGTTKLKDPVANCCQGHLGEASPPPNDPIKLAAEY